MTLPLVPGVYPETRPRTVDPPAPRTDVCGFVGFEPRVRDGGSRLFGSPAVGHRFAVDVVRFQTRIDGARVQVEPVAGLVLSSSESTAPIADGGSIVYSLIAVRDGARADMRIVAGGATADDRALAASDPTVNELCGERWVRLADVAIRRKGAHVFTTIVPRLDPVLCDDWEEFQLAHGPFDEADQGFLGRTVRAFFANGGRRCHVAPVRRPDPEDAAGVRRAALDITGIPGSSEREATGFERLFLIEEVAIVDVPDLYARRILDGGSVSLPPAHTGACFRPCGPAAGPITAKNPGQPGAPIFHDALVLEVQRTLMLRAAAERWRVQLLLNAPVEFDPLVGDYPTPSHPRAIAWRAALDGATDDLGAAATAFYHPWLVASDREGGPLLELPPGGFAAGIIARRDLARGPLVAPANEAVLGGVALARPVDDRDQAALYTTPTHIDVVRTFPGRGLWMWGARTLSSDGWLRFLNVRRGLSAIERRIVAAFRPLVFEPNTPSLWFRMTQVALSVLFEQYQRGTLRGASPEEAFYIRCDETNNPADQIALGRVVCEVGVAIAAPAEFVIFRISRNDELLAVEEA